MDQATQTFVGTLICLIYLVLIIVLMFSGFFDYLCADRKITDMSTNWWYNKIENKRLKNINKVTITLKYKDTYLYARSEFFKGICSTYYKTVLYSDSSCKNFLFTIYEDIENPKKSKDWWYNEIEENFKILKIENEETEKENKRREEIERGEYISSSVIRVGFGGSSSSKTSSS